MGSVATSCALFAGERFDLARGTFSDLVDRIQVGEDRIDFQAGN